jgi:hypothetical protein
MLAASPNDSDPPERPRREPVPLDPTLIRALRTRLDAWEAGALGDPVRAHRRGLLTGYLAMLRALVDQEERVVAVLLAGLALGPRGAARVDARPLGTLLEIAVRTHADVIDLCIAWGCGWGHSARLPDEHRDRRSEAAVLALSALVEGSISRTLTWLEDNVSGVRAALGAWGPTERRHRVVIWAYLIAMELALGACRGGHGVSVSGECRRPEHALAGWVPRNCRLSAYVATAVRGHARLPLRAGAFAVSMLAVLLQDEQVVRVDTVEFCVCHSCSGDLPRVAIDRRAVRLSDLARGLHDLSRCPDCGAPADPEHTYRLARKNWLVVPAAWGGPYEAACRRRCAGCGNLFPATQDRCPLCGQHTTTGGRLTSVWVRRSGR